jgi:RNA polymerase sigma-70 factor (ECF subfamily)
VGFLRTRLQANESLPDQGNSDAQLVARARQGDAQAFALLYRRYLDQVYDFCAYRLDSREAAEDATQTIFLKAVSSLPQCRDGTVFAGWLFAIARNVINDQYRSRRIATQPLESAPDFEDASDTPERLAERAESARELAQLRADCLNAGERELLDLRLQGLNDREIGEALGRNHGAIRTAQYRMVLKLRECIDQPRPSSIQKEATHVER